MPNTLVNNSIAVLPFINRSDKDEAKFFSEGISEEIINALSKIIALRVTSRTSSFSIKDKNLSIPEIGNLLNVNIILEGSVRLSGNRVRITAQLIDVANDFHFWSETFDRNMDNIFEIQDEISIHIADKLREHLGHFEFGDHLVESENISVGDYKEYLKGRYYLMKLDKPNTLRAIKIFKGIIESSPEFPRPYLDINQGYTYLGTMGLLPSYEAFMMAQPFLEKGITLNPNAARTQLNLAWINFYQKWDIPAAIQSLQNALETSPSDEIYLTFSNFMAVQGEFNKALELVDKSIQIAPLSSTNMHFKGFIYYLTEDFEKALPFFHKSLSLQEDLPFPHLYIGLSLMHLGKVKEAIDYFNNLKEHSKSDLTKIGGLTICHALQKDEHNTNLGIKQLEAAMNTEAMGSALNFLILTYAAMEEMDKAIAFIRTAMEHRLPLLLLLKTDPNIKLLKNHPDFIVIMDQIFGKVQIEDKKSKTKYKKSLLTEEEKSNYRNRLDVLMKEEQPFLEPTLSLRGLANQLAIHPNQLSQLLNEVYHQNFAEFINSSRVDHFKLALQSPKNKSFTLLAIAYNSGFNSKTVFNTFFKKITGETPKKFWNRIQKEI